MKLLSPAALSAIIVVALSTAIGPATNEAAAQESGRIIGQSDGVNTRATPDTIPRGVDSSVTTIRRSSDFGEVGTQPTPAQRSPGIRRDFGPRGYSPKPFGTRQGVQGIQRQRRVGGGSTVGIRK